MRTWTDFRKPEKIPDYSSMILLRSTTICMVSALSVIFTNPSILFVEQRFVVHNERFAILY
jgi:hypothetical protein